MKFSCKSKLLIFFLLIPYIFSGCSRNGEESKSEAPPIIAPAGYEIFKEAKGDLNQDGDEDTVVMLQKINDQYSPTEVIVFLWTTEDTRSSNIIPLEFARDESTSLKIDNNQLIINTGTSTSKIQSRFRYFEGRLKLIQIEKFSNDTENNHSLSFDLINSKIEETGVSVRSFNFPEVYFADANPSEIIQQTLDELYTESFTYLSVTNATQIIPPGYKALADAENDLNGDGLLDRVIAIQRRDDLTEQINTLVYLKNKESSYRLDKQSTSVIPPENTPDEIPIFESVSLNIENGVLEIGIFRSTSSSRSIFSYLDESLRLVKIEYFAAGAGGLYNATIDLLKSLLEETETNTLDENMPATTTSRSISFPNLYFQTVDPEKIVEQAMKEPQEQTVTGILIAGGGIDNYSLNIETHDGDKINAYCQTDCDDWFVDDTEGNSGGVVLKESLQGRKVSAHLATEANNGRLAGPSDEEEFMFLKKLEFLE